MNIYIACALSHVPIETSDTYFTFLRLLAENLRKDSHVVSYALADSEPKIATVPEADKARLCYEWDRKLVEESDLVIAEVSFSSTGVGIELEIANSRNIPILLCYMDINSNRSKFVETHNMQTDEEINYLDRRIVSLMALGVPSVIGCFEYKMNQSTDSLCEYVNNLK